MLLSGCFSMMNMYKKPETIKEPDTPITVDDSETISFRKVIIKIPYGTVIGKLFLPPTQIKDLKWESSTIEGEKQFTETGEKILNSYGYRVLEKGDDLFDTSNSEKARFQIAGVISSLFFNVGGKNTLISRIFEHDISMDVEWQVYDSFKEKVVFKLTTHGEYYTEDDEPINVAELAYIVFERAMCDLLANKELSAILVDKTVENETEETYADIDINYSRDALKVKLPDDISKLFDAVVTIKTGVTHGSGVIVSSEGYILTAAHVVSGVEKVNIVFHSNIQLEAKVVRINKSKDTALLKVQGTQFKYLPLHFNRPAIGSEIFIIGTPLEKQFSYSVTKGIISNYLEEDGNELIQTDAAVNPGNSGGPLIDKNGFLVGIISKKIVGFEVEGLGFAVSLETIFDTLSIKKKE